MACPHANIVYCPLYLAAHHAGAPSCDDGRMGDGECAVARGLEYASTVAKLNPRFVARLKFNEEAEQLRQQRVRNMKASGLQ